MANNESTYITDEEALAIFGKEYGKMGPVEMAKAKELELYARTHPEFDRELLTMTTVLYIISSGKKPQEFTETDIRVINRSDDNISEEEALTIFGAEYGKVGPYEKAKAKELELYARTHPEFDRELVNMTTVLFIISSGKKPHEFTTTDIKLIKWSDKHNLRNGTGPISKANDKIRRKFPMQNLQKIAIIFGALAGSLYILIKALIRYY